MLKETLDTMNLALKELADINYALDESLIVAITDQTGKIIFANSKFCEISKYSKEELLGQNHRIINSGHHSKEFFRTMWRTIAQGKVWRGEIKNKAKDGTYYWMDTTIVPCLNKDRKPYQYVSFRIDITDRKKAEEYLRRSDKIAAAGQLASAIAHEIRNPLAAIKWTVELLQSNNSNADQKQFEMILSELDRVNSIVGELLLLSKPHVASLKSQDLQPLVEMVVSLMNIQARRAKIDILLELEDNLPTVRCDESQIKQVFINLLKNSIEAMPKGGKIRVAGFQNQDNQVVFRIKDEGVGIPPELIARLGEPFHTTKDNGTGLGLMICHKIVEEHHGRLDIHSEINRGTTIDIILPVASSLDASAQPTA
ncbi:PAS domain S-box protein [Alicyclobacillus tolerans]|uniref:ATP-binding protein n=1 Tax=Alicyclobacillus tolerans TaxID=90970 RepID=UPI001F29501B|nr:ATP-binding protein [Alicyclobacillus tolerans]MCF8566760.1 PAS domain S-box protein [Alicyclobacillus tolerans]